MYFFDFQNFAKLIIFLNFFIPIISFGLIFKTDVETSPAFALCNGQAYRNFFTTKYLGKQSCRITCHHLWIFSDQSYWLGFSNNSILYIPTKLSHLAKVISLFFSRLIFSALRESVLRNKQKRSFVITKPYLIIF